MIGTIMSYNATTGRGLLLGQDSETYLFTSDAITGNLIAKSGASAYYEQSYASKIAGKVDILKVIPPPFDWEAA